MATMSEPLEWTDDNHAYRDKALYHVYERSNGKWNVALFSMHTMNRLGSRRSSVTTW